MKISTKILSLALSVISVKADLFGLLDTQIVEGCPQNQLNVAISKCVENDKLLKNNKKIYYYNPPKPDEKESCDRTINVKATSEEECAPVQIFDEPTLSSITSFSNNKFNISKFINITCELEDDKKKVVKDCVSWKINEKSLTIGDITTTDTSLVDKVVKASVTLNIKPNISSDKMVVFSYNGENGFQFSINNENKLTMSAAEFDKDRTYGYAELFNETSKTLTWSFMSKLKKNNDASEDKVNAIIDAIIIQGASVLSLDDAKKESETKIVNNPAKLNVTATDTDNSKAIKVNVDEDDDEKEETTDNKDDDEKEEPTDNEDDDEKEETTDNKDDDEKEEPSDNKDNDEKEEPIDNKDDDEKEEPTDNKDDDKKVKPAGEENTKEINTTEVDSEEKTSTTTSKPTEDSEKSNESDKEKN